MRKIGKDILDTAFAIHTEFGSGLLEKAYRIILANELRRLGHIVEEERTCGLTFNGIKYNNMFRVDLMVDDAVMAASTQLVYQMRIEISTMIPPTPKTWSKETALLPQNTHSSGRATSQPPSRTKPAQNPSRYMMPRGLPLPSPELQPAMTSHS